MYLDYSIGSLITPLLLHTCIAGLGSVFNVPLSDIIWIKYLVASDGLFYCISQGDGKDLLDLAIRKYAVFSQSLSVVWLFPQASINLQ